MASIEEVANSGALSQILGAHLFESIDSGCDFQTHHRHHHRHRPRRSPNRSSHATPLTPGAPVQSVDFVGEIKHLEQSDVVVLLVTFASPTHHTLRLLLKHVDLPSQQARIDKTPEKWAISVQSFQNEYDFFGRGAAMDDRGELASIMGIAAGLSLPRCYYRSRFPADERLPMQRSTLLLEYLAPEEYEQHQDLTLAQVKEALGALAQFHAFYWEDDGPLQDSTGMKRRLFERGGWWRAELRPSVKFDTIVASFESLCATFPAEFADINNAESRALLGKLQAHYRQLGQQLRAKGSRTLMHGDCKTSNLFFRRGGGGDCTLIDFQWTGAASSGGGDVAYLLWSGVEPAAIVGAGQEAALLDYYYEALMTAMPGNEGRYTRAEFQHDYELEFLDVFKTCLPQLLNGLTPADCRVHYGEFGWLTHEYHPAVTRAFVGRALAALRSWDPNAQV